MVIPSKWRFPVSSSIINGLSANRIIFDTGRFSFLKIFLPIKIVPTSARIIKILNMIMLPKMLWGDIKAAI